MEIYFALLPLSFFFKVSELVWGGGEASEMTLITLHHSPVECGFPTAILGDL